MRFIETRRFTARLRELVSDDEYRQVQLALAEKPDAGVIVPGTGGIRKLRWSGSGRGKSGGMRYLYYWAPQPHSS